MNAFDHQEIDPIIHSRIRLAVLAILASVEAAEFTYLRDAVKTTDGNLSTHISKLIDVGYVAGVTSSKSAAGRPPTRFHLTREGRSAFRGYLRRMDELTGGLDR